MCFQLVSVDDGLSVRACGARCEVTGFWPAADVGPTSATNVGDPGRPSVLAKAVSYGTSACCWLRDTGLSIRLRMQQLTFSEAGEVGCRKADPGYGQSTFMLLS